MARLLLSCWLLVATSCTLLSLPLLVSGAVGGPGGAAAAAAGDYGTLAIPNPPNSECRTINTITKNGLTVNSLSSACPNVDWLTYGWIQNIQLQSRAFDNQLTPMFDTAKTSGTRKCQRWYKDLMCRYTFPKCAVHPTDPQGGPCRSECETFSKSCPGLAMSCAAFSNNTKTCWLSQTAYAYGYSNAATPSAFSSAILPITLMVSVFVSLVVMKL